jgi:hypothetical protein
VSKVVSIHARQARPPGARPERVRPRPYVLIIDRPRSCLLGTLLVAVALLATGGAANDLLRAPSRLVCEAPPSEESQEASPAHAPVTFAQDALVSAMFGW